MADVPASNIAHLGQLLDTLRRRQQVLEEQYAIYGSAAAPTHLVIEKEDVERQIVDIQARLEQAQAQAADIGSPYLGLLTFQEQDADRFFGRDQLVNQLIEQAHAAFLAVLGASGSGKSSVVRAGLIPRLKRGALPGSESWRYAVLRPGARPVDALAAELARLQGDPTRVVQYAETLATSDRALLLLATALVDQGAGQRLALFVDQFEELWTRTPSEERAQFINVLLAAANAPDPPLLLVLAMRADFLHRAAEQPALARAIAENDLIVSPMTAEELHAAIARPAEAAGGNFQPGLVDELVDQALGRSGALPLLEYTLQELWKQRRPDGLMTWESYRALGGIEGALAARADAILAEHYTPDQQQQLRQLLLRLVQPGEGAADTRRRIPLDDLAPAGTSLETIQALLTPLTDERLLTTGHDATSGDETIEVSHEALIQAWPTFGRWIAEHRDDLRFQLQLEDAAKEWAASGESVDFLWSGLRLDNAEAWLARSQPQLNARDERFLDASRTQRQTQITEEQARIASEEAARQRELDQARALAASAVRLRRLLIVLGLAFIAVLIAVSSAGWFWYRATTVAQNIIRIGRAFNLASLAREGDHSPQQSLLLALEAVHTAQPNDSSAPVAQESLRGLLAGVGGVPLHGHTGPVTGAIFSPNGQWLATSSEDGTARIWRLDAPEHPVAVLRGHSQIVRALAFSPDSQRLATAGGDGTVRLWDMAALDRPATVLRGHTLDVVAVAFSPNGRYLASASDDKTARLWQLDKLDSEATVLHGHTDKLLAVVFSPDSHWLASAGQDGTVRVWAVGAPAQASAILAGLGHSVLAVDFSPDSHQLVIGSDDGATRLWRVGASAQEVSILHQQGQGVSKVVFSKDGRWLANGNLDGTVRLWNAEALAQDSNVLLGRKESVAAMAFSPDSQWLVTGGSSGTIQIWQVNASERAPIVLRGHEGMINSVAFSPDARWLVTASDDQTARLWRASSPESSPIVLRGHDQPVSAAAFSSDGHRLVTGANDGTVQLWEVDHPERSPVALPGQTARVVELAFSPDGRRLAVGTDDLAITLWRIDGPKPEPSELQGHTDSVTSVAFSGDGRWLASASFDGTARLWPLDGAAPAAVTLSGHSGWVRALAFSPNSQWLATGGQDDTARLWRVGADASAPIVLRGHTEDVVALAFSSDGRWLATGSEDKTARLWDMSALDRAPVELRGHTQAVVTLAFSPDGRYLATGSLDNTARLWELANPESSPIVLRGHDGGVKAVAFSGDNKLLATGAGDGTARLWQVDAIDGGPTKLTGQTNGLFAMTFSPDGRYLATGNGDGAARLWHTRAEDIADLACMAAGRNLGLEEWQQFVDTEATYRATCPQLPLHPTAYYAILARGQIDAALASYDNQRRQDPSLDPPAAWLIRMAGAMLADGQAEWREPAMAAYRRALTFDTPLSAADPNALNDICAFGDRERYAKDIIRACDQAVDFDMAHGNFRYNRAIVRMYLDNLKCPAGDNLKCAAEDLRVFMTWATGHRLGETKQAEVQAWIEQLDHGKNPLR